jgi:arylsulfatase A-like enzyme
VHEGGISTPLIAHWPAGISAKNELRTTPAHVIDIVPTVLELAGIEKPKQWKGKPIPEAPGKSLVPAFCQRRNHRPRLQLWWLHEGNKAIRVGDWKLVAAKGDAWALYDLKTDRAEQHDLAAKMPDKVKELEASWQSQTDDFTDAREENARRSAEGQRQKHHLRHGRRHGLGPDRVSRASGAQDAELDAMAANGLRFDRFYAGESGVLAHARQRAHGTHERSRGRAHHGYALRLQEKTIAQALKGAGYVTGHFGKWHLNGSKAPAHPSCRRSAQPRRLRLRRMGVGDELLRSEPAHESQGEFVEFKGDSSDIVVNEALKFIENITPRRSRCFTVIWYGTPHAPFKALDADKAASVLLDKSSQDHYGELVAHGSQPRQAAQKLRDSASPTTRCSSSTATTADCPASTPTVGGLRGNKGSVFEGGLRVPGIIEWPA